MDQMPVLRIQTLFESRMRHGADQPFGVLPPMQDGDANNLSKQYSHARAHNARAQFSLTDCQRELCSFLSREAEQMMTLAELAEQCFTDNASIQNRIEELTLELRKTKNCQEQLKLRRRIRNLKSMSNELIRTGTYLRDYYKKD